MTHLLLWACPLYAVAMTLDDPDLPDLLASLRSALDAPNPMDLLQLASTLLSSGEEPSQPFQPSPARTTGRMDPRLAEVLETLLAMPTPETDSLLIACAELLGDPSFQETVREQVRPRLQVMPAWLAELPRLRVRRAFVLHSVLGGEETIFLEAKGLRGSFTLMVGVETLGVPFVEDAYPIDENVELIAQRLASKKMTGLALEQLDLQDARARIEDALKITDSVVPAIRTDSWPWVRPLLEWQLRTMPGGGAGYTLPVWDDEDSTAYLDDFMASRYTAGYLQNDRLLADLLVDLALNYGSGDPRQWSPRFVERLMMDLVPRKVLFAPEDLRAIPRVLGALIIFGGEKLGVPEPVTQRTLDLLEELLPHYLEMLDLGEQMVQSPWDTGFLEEPPFIDVLRLISDAVGSQEALEHLDMEPLPTDEPLRFEGVPDDILTQVVAIGELVGRYAAQYFADPEMVTAAYRTLHFLASENPEVFRRRSKDLNTAAAILYIAGHNNRWFDQADPERTVVALAKLMGVGAISWDRAFNMTKDLDSGHIPLSGPTTLSLGRADLLTSSRRESLLRQKADLEDLIESGDGYASFEDW